MRSLSKCRHCGKRRLRTMGPWRAVVICTYKPCSRYRVLQQAGKKRR